MASNEDEVDFSSKFTVYSDQNKELVTIPLDQKKMMLIAGILLGLVFIVLVALNAVDTKELRDLSELVKEFSEHQ